MAIPEEYYSQGHHYEFGPFGTAFTCHKCNDENGMTNFDCAYDDDI